MRLSYAIGVFYTLYKKRRPAQFRAYSSVSVFLGRCKRVVLGCCLTTPWDNYRLGTYTRKVSDSGKLAGKDIDQPKTIINGATYSECEYKLEVSATDSSIAVVTILQNYNSSSNIIYRIPLVTYVKDGGKAAQVTVDPGCTSVVEAIRHTYIKPPGINTNGSEGHDVDVLESSVALPNEKVTILLTIGSDIYTRNGEALTLDAPPYISADNRTMVPVRFIAEGFGAKVTWVDSEKSDIIELNGNTVYCKVGEALPDNMGMPVIKDDRLFVPIRYITSSLGAIVDWDALIREVVITMENETDKP